jgi:hypothetical protein
MISRELIWQDIKSEKTLDLQGFHGVSRSGETGCTELAIWCLRPLGHLSAASKGSPGELNTYALIG